MFARRFFPHLLFFGGSVGKNARGTKNIKFEKWIKKSGCHPLKYVLYTNTLSPPTPSHVAKQWRKCNFENWTYIKIRSFMWHCHCLFGTMRTSIHVNKILIESQTFLRLLIYRKSDGECEDDEKRQMNLLT